MMNSCRPTAAVLVSLCVATTVMGVEPVERFEQVDWPTYRHDSRRSGYSPHGIEAPRLAMSWYWQSAHPPQPAWYGPAKKDAYANINDLPSMRGYDPVFHPIAVGDSVFFCSTSEDTVYCLDAISGRESWSYTTDGPVRGAPTYAHGRIYFGSDDGYAYCLDAQDGTLVWKFSPAPGAKRVLNNGRLISLWPCRTGVLVEHGVAYFANSMFPWEDSYLCAVDARLGRPTETTGYVVRQSEMTMEGPLAASANLLISPQGRVSPHLFRRADGKSLGNLKGSRGGSIVVLAMDAKIFYGPAGGKDLRAGGFEASSAETREKIASYARGKDIAIAGRRAFLLTHNKLTASDWVDQKDEWQVSCGQNLALIVVGDIVFVGGEDEVAAYSAADGHMVWNHPVDGKAHGLAVARGRLLVSTDVGTLYAFAPGLTTWNSRPAGKQGKKLSAQTPIGQQKPAERRPLAAGPWLQFVAPGQAAVRWRTAEPSPTILQYGPAGDTRPVQIEDVVLKSEHEVMLDGLKRNRVYTYVIQRLLDKRLQPTQPHECDTFFDYTLVPAAHVPSPWEEGNEAAAVARTAGRILERTEIKQGICLMLGCGDGRLAYELVRQSRLRVIAVDVDAEKVGAAREALREAKVYGGRVAVHHVKSYAESGLPGEFANLIVSESLSKGNATAGVGSELRRMLKPARGVAYLWQPPGRNPAVTSQQWQRWLPDGGVSVTTGMDGPSHWALIKRNALTGVGQWSHIYGRADNSAFGGEELAGARSTDDLEVQWVGRPGPRYQPDRNGRKPSPLSTGGRLFLQGERRLIALDTANGSILWSLEIPELERFNMPRDCSNWCADENHVYAAVRNACWRIDAETGRVEQMYGVVSPGERAFDWGYISTQGRHVVGSSVLQGTSWKGFSGKIGWYDAKSGEQTAKICSESLFALEKESGECAWAYRNGLVLNPTITIAEGRIYFVETRNDQVKSLATRRIDSPQLWNDLFLVALELDSGEKVWEQRIEPVPGVVALYLAYSDDTLVLVSSADDNYHLYVHDTATGNKIWERSLPWLSDNHGGHMSRPAIVGGTLYVRPHVMKLSDGTLLPEKMPGGKCGTYACSTGALFMRGDTLAMWNRHQGEASTWSRLRPDCWLSTIPADGMLLSPEGGGGCSCGSWLETSIVFKPIPSLRKGRL